MTIAIIHLNASINYFVVNTQKKKTCRKAKEKTKDYVIIFGSNSLN